MLKTKKTLEKGFTIVELLIVIVVIGILAALVLNTFSGVQKRARDSERQTDINSLATQLEVYYNDNGGYPIYSQIDTVAEAKALFKGIDQNALSAPGTTNVLTNATATNKDQYGYVGSGCTTAVNSCASFVLSYWKENQTGTPVATTKASLN